jgi:hypothetical protein
LVRPVFGQKKWWRCPSCNLKVIKSYELPVFNFQREWRNCERRSEKREVRKGIGKEDISVPSFLRFISSLSCLVWFYCFNSQNLYKNFLSNICLASQLKMALNISGQKGNQEEFALLVPPACIKGDPKETGIIRTYPRPLLSLRSSCNQISNFRPNCLVRAVPTSFPSPFKDEALTFSKHWLIPSPRDLTELKNHKKDFQSKYGTLASLSDIVC